MKCILLTDLDVALSYAVEVENLSLLEHWLYFAIVNLFCDRKRRDLLELYCTIQSFKLSNYKFSRRVIQESDMLESLFYSFILRYNLSFDEIN